MGVEGLERGLEQQSLREIKWKGKQVSIQHQYKHSNQYNMIARMKYWDFIILQFKDSYTYYNFSVLFLCRKMLHLHTPNVDEWLLTMKIARILRRALVRMLMTSSWKITIQTLLKTAMTTSFKASLSL